MTTEIADDGDALQKPVACRQLGIPGSARKRGALHVPGPQGRVKAGAQLDRLAAWGRRPTGTDVVTPRGVWHVEWQELHVGYLHDVYLALVRRAVQPSDHWMAEFLPRSASILIEDRELVEECVLALAWDEESGWRFGSFVRGDVRCPTLLRRQRYFGGDVLPDPAEVGDTVLAIVERLRQPRRWWWGHHREQPWGWHYPPAYRSYRDVDDGFDDRLREHLPPDVPYVAPREPSAGA
ncbi:DUF6292 family protein [Nonomuraea salmonea]|uniref:DUF6292 family protein n=1 Tax=Nonomuraea salmonea TaxID=46181 RepID=UPI00360F4BC3